MDAYNESQRLLLSLHKDNEKWEEKIVYVQSKAKEIFEKESLLKFMNIALLREKELDKKVSKLTDRAVSTYGIYFKRARKHVLFL